MVGNEGVITVEEAKGTETEVKTVEGMQFDRGYSSLLVTNPDKMEAELDNPYILIHDKKISNADLLPCWSKLRKVVAHSSSLPRMWTKLATLVVNKIRGALKVAVKAPGWRSSQGHAARHRHPHRRSSDFGRTGLKLENTTVADLGTAEKITIDKDNTTVVNGAETKGPSRLELAKSRPKSKPRRPITTAKSSRASRQVGGRCGGALRGRSHRSGDEGKERPRRRRLACRSLQ